MKVHRFIFLAVLILLGCSSNPTKSISVIDANRNITVLNDLDLSQHKKLIDSLANDTNSLEVYAKVPNNKKLILVKKGNSLKW